MRGEYILRVCYRGYVYVITIKVSLIVKRLDEYYNLLKLLCYHSAGHCVHDKMKLLVFSLLTYNQMSRKYNDFPLDYFFTLYDLNASVTTHKIITITTTIVSKKYNIRESLDYSILK